MPNRGQACTTDTDGVWVVQAGEEYREEMREETQAEAQQMGQERAQSVAHGQLVGVCTERDVVRGLFLIR
jgi:CBS domain-containing protein